MKPRWVFAFLFILLLSACAAPQTPAQIVSVYAAPSAQFWLADAYACADDLSIVIKMETNDPDIYLRLGALQTVTSPAYQIGEEEIWVAANPALQVESLSREEARGLFTQGNPAVQIWVYSAGEDLQREFERLALSDSRVVSSASIAASVGQMSATLSSETNAVGILPKRALAGNVRGIFSAGKVPVLAVLRQEPQGAAAGLIACLQR